MDLRCKVVLGVWILAVVWATKTATAATLRRGHSESASQEHNVANGNSPKRDEPQPPSPHHHRLTPDELIKILMKGGSHSKSSGVHVHSAPKTISLLTLFKHRRRDASTHGTREDSSSDDKSASPTDELDKMSVSELKSLYNTIRNAMTSKSPAYDHVTPGRHTGGVDDLKQICCNIG